MYSLVKEYIQKTSAGCQHAVDFFLKIIESRGFRLFTYGYFLFQSIYVAISTNWRIVPDAGAHLGRIRLFARDGIDPFIQNQKGFHFLGDMVRNPDTLYHYLFSLVYRVSPFEDADALGNQLPSDDTATILLFKFLNIALVLGGLVMFYKLMKQLGLPALVRNLSLFMMTNALMFIFLSGGINYDNMLFLVAMTVFYFLVKFMQTHSLRSLLALLSFLAITGLVKVAFMPIGIVVFVIALYVTTKHRSELLSEVKNVPQLPRAKKAAFGALVALLLISGTFFVERYGVNVAKYGTPQPGCLQLHTLEECNKSAIFARSQRFQDTPTTYELGPIEFSVEWSLKMRSYLFTAIGHKAFSETNLIKYGSFLFAGLMAIAAIRKFDRKEHEINTLLFISLYFVLILLLINYFRAYMNSGIFGIALQGRYVFPVLPLLFAIGNYYVLKFFSKRWLHALYSVFILAIFIPSGILNYIFWTDKSWHTEYVPDIHYVIQQKLRWFNAKIISIFY